MTGHSVPTTGRGLCRAVSSAQGILQADNAGLINVFTGMGAPVGIGTLALFSDFLTILIFPVLFDQTRSRVFEAFPVMGTGIARRRFVLSVGGSIRNDTRLRGNAAGHDGCGGYLLCGRRCGACNEQDSSK